MTPTPRPELRRAFLFLSGWTGLPDFLSGRFLDGFAHLGLLHASLWLLPRSLVLALLPLLASVLWSFRQAAR